MMQEINSEGHHSHSMHATQNSWQLDITDEAPRALPSLPAVKSPREPMLESGIAAKESAELPSRRGSQ